MNPPDPVADRALLRRFEPIIKYTRGEQFFPMHVEDYVRECSLWLQRSNQSPVCLVPEGKLTLERLSVTPLSDFETVQFLRYIEPPDILVLAGYVWQENRWRAEHTGRFDPGRGRLARVGYTSRLVAALFSLSLLARGRVPGDTALAAAVAYHKNMAERERYIYYGRVVREGGWVVLQYWYFYAFNNWRSGFYGVNDHEADWEMACVYLSTTPEGDYLPEWVAYASHDFHGDDLRRRWDDPELVKQGEHPVIFAGAGSHASYFQNGEYLTEMELPFLRPLVKVVDAANARLREWLGRAEETRAAFNLFRIPFVDYARGDGLSIGAGQAKTWAEPVLLDPIPDWALNYRGLWGLYARDPVAGENAPAGPLYNRDGSFRKSWHSPLAWAGLDKLPPSDHDLMLTQARWAELERHTTELSQHIESKQATLVSMGLDAAAMHGRPYFRTRHSELNKAIAALSDEIATLRAQRADEMRLAEALRARAARIQRGERDSLRAHIKHAHTPSVEPEAQRQMSRFVEAWSALSIGLLMLGFVLVLAFARQYTLFWMTAMVAAIVFIEAGFRRQFTQVMVSLSVGLAVVCALVLVFNFFWTLAVLGIIVAGLYIMWENAREVFRRR